MPLKPGTRMGSYEVVSAIGVGGMGEVHRARDLALHRLVAIKTLPDIFVADAERAARFAREAHALAALNHPNIAQIYGLIGPTDGGPAIVMELVEGQDLAQRIALGAMPVDEALPIARQVADALCAAHEQGIVHRDLKPANIRVRSDGTVKVLDFGLAKAVAPVGQRFSAHAGLEDCPTMTTLPMTASAVILGTAAYMAPEQARGGEVDKRVDIWAFGCLLFEMVTGRRAFGGANAQETITAVLRDEPDWGLLPPGLSASAERFLRRCFAKNPRERVQDAGDLRLALDGAFDVPSAGAGTFPAAITSRPVRTRLGYVASVMLTASVLASAAVWWLRPGPSLTETRIRRFVISPEPASLQVATSNRDVAISPDGTLLAYMAKEGSVAALYVRRLDSLTPILLRRSDRYFEPFFSHDSRWVAFNDETDLTLRKIPVTGGPPVAIAQINAEMLGASWRADDTIVYATQDGLWRVSAGGGTPESLLKRNSARGELSLAWPTVLPGSETILYAVRSGGRVEDWAVHALDLGNGATKLVVRGGTNPLYSPTGHLLYTVEQVLHGIAFDTTRIETRGEAIPLVEGVLAKASGGSNVVLAADGTLAYVAGGDRFGMRDLMWLHRDGRTEWLGLPPRPYGVARISPDGRRIAAEVRWEQWELWTWDVVRRVLSLLTTPPNSDSYPVWTPDSRELVFASQREGSRRLYVQAADGTGHPRRLVEAFNADAVTPDGRHVIFRRDGVNGSDLMMAPVDGRSEPVPLVATRANELNGEVSFHGRWLAYQSDESGNNEVYVRPFPNVRGGRWQISYGGGRQPMWGRDGRELFFIDAQRRLAAVRVSPGAALVTSRPERVSEVAFFTELASRSYDISHDGKRFLVLQRVPGTHQPNILLVENWTRELTRISGR
jgi:serine/threonine-protein kinase